MRNILILISLAMLLASCGTAGKPEAEQPDTAGRNAETEIEIVIGNRLEARDIVEVWVDPSDDPWSDNLLDENLAPGEEFVLFVSEETAYDFQIIDEDGESYTLMGQNVDEDGFIWNIYPEDSDWAEVPVGEPVTVTIENGLSDESIWYVYGTLSSNDDWGPDRLDYMVLEYGETFSYEVESDQYYDFYARNGDSDFYFSFDNYIGYNGLTWRISQYDLDNTLYEDETHGATAPITLINRLGNVNILYAFEDESGGEYWNEDLLEGDVLEPAEEFTFYLRADRFYDFQVEDEYGNIYTLWDVAVKDNGVFWEVILDDKDE